MSSPPAPPASSPDGPPADLPASSDEQDEQDEKLDSGLAARTYAVCALCTVSCAVFFLTGVAPMPVLLYFPIARRFGFAPHPTELAMDFYGRSLLALLAGLAAALSIYAAVRATHKRGAPTRLLLLTGYAATALLLAATLFGYQLSVRVPTP